MEICYSSDRKLKIPAGREGGTGKSEEKKAKENAKKENHKDQKIKSKVIITTRLKNTGASRALRTRQLTERSERLLKVGSVTRP